MSINRIQKLLFSEYCDFEDMVLVESPFAETTRDGRGLRQVHLGLTPSKLVLATDKMPFAFESTVTYRPGIDPYIETFELIAVYPIDCVNLSIFHRRKRQSLKARFCNNKILYFELGGFEKRNMLWNLWCEKVKFLNPDNPNSSNSETSVATSTTNSTLYLVSSKLVNHMGNSQLWCQYASGDFARSIPAKWTDKYLYLGKNLDESPAAYTPKQPPPTVGEFVMNKHVDSQRTNGCKRSMISNITSNGMLQVNRFSTNVGENCNTGLFLPAEDMIVKQKFSNFTTKSIDLFTMYKTIPEVHNMTMVELAESAVRLWEFYKVTTSMMSARGKHRRRYAFCPQPHFLHGLGPWNVNQGERFSLQMKRAVSVVAIKRQPAEPELRLSVSRRQLVASISCDALCCNDKLININHNTIRLPPKRPVIFFWTPEYWYRPRSARDVYQELQTHLKKIRHYHQFKESFKAKIARRIYQSRKNISNSSTSSFSSEEEDIRQKVYKSRKKIILNKLRPLSRKFSEKDEFRPKEPKETSLQYLKRILRLQVALSAWDFDSNTLAYQLTLIDKELFLKINPSELGVLIWQQSSKNAPNIGALIAFSHRISCLVVTEVLREDSEKIRARLVSRFINTAEKCFKISNFQSCRSVLCGLQSPPVYRLYSMWSYLRKRHSSKYETFEKLCRLYRDPRLSLYQKTFNSATKTTPYLPFIGDFIGKLLDRIPEYNSSTSNLGINILINPKNDEDTTSKEKEPSLLRKILSTLKMFQSDKDNTSSGITAVPEDLSSTDFKVLECFDDNRQSCLNKCVLLLEMYQRAASGYAYTKNDLAREYLLKARYREDKENFNYSFNVEPPLDFEK